MAPSATQCYCIVIRGICSVALPSFPHHWLARYCWQFERLATIRGYIKCLPAIINRSLRLITNQSIILKFSQRLEWMPTATLRFIANHKNSRPSPGPDFEIQTDLQLQVARTLPPDFWRSAEQRANTKMISQRCNRNNAMVIKNHDDPRDHNKLNSMRSEQQCGQIRK